MVRALWWAAPVADTPPVRVPIFIVIAVGAAAVVTGACGSSGAIPRPFPTPGPTPPTVTRPGDSSPAAPVPGTIPPSAATPPASKPRVDTYALTGTALGLRGVPYRDGGSDPKGFDCSGFTKYVFNQHGIVLPREVKEQYAAGRSIKPEDISAGDLIFFTTVAPGASHVGIALGGDTFVHAPSSTGQVRVERMTATYWSQRFVGARRVE